MEEPPARTLTPRQGQILAAVADGHRPGNIARDLNLAPETVKNHLSKALKTLGARNRAHAVAIALRTGLIA